MCFRFYFIVSHVSSPQAPLSRAPFGSNLFPCFTDSFSGFYITCIYCYHVQQSEYRLGSALPPVEPPSTQTLLLSPSSIFAQVSSTQALRLAVSLPGSPLLSPLLDRSSFRLPSGQNLIQTRSNYASSSPNASLSSKVDRRTTSMTLSRSITRFSGSKEPLNGATNLP
jgi:hypothetical protein